MANGIFIIQELRRVGGVLVGSQNPDGGERFEWTSDTRAQDPSVGGARACPLQPWNIGGRLRTKKTWYNGAKSPSEQVQGPEFKDQTFSGGLDDRYNFPGYALDVKRRFEAMCERGNYVRISYQQEAWEGIITDWDLQFRRSWDIPYSFTFSVHGRPEDRALADRSPPTVLSTAQVFDNVDVGVQAMLDTHSDAPVGMLTGDTADVATGKLAVIAGARDDLSNTLDQNDYRPNSRPFSKIASLLHSINRGASDLIDNFAYMRSDTEVIVRTAMATLDFESWSRSMRFQARVAMGDSRRAAAEIDERTDAKVERLYRPRVGELLYSVSTRFYGTPHAWRIIADRNRIRYFKLLGTELLMIPERGEG